MATTPPPSSTEAPTSTALPVPPTATDRPAAVGTPGRGRELARLIRAEWTKLRSVPRWVATLLAAVGLTVLVALLTASASTSGFPDAAVDDDQADDDIEGNGPETTGGTGNPGDTGDVSSPRDLPDMGFFPEGIPLEHLPDREGFPGGDEAWVESLRLAEITDRFHLVHQPLVGEGSIVARVASQEDSHEWAKAGLLLKERAEWGAPYAALMVTPEHGVRLQTDFTEDVAGSDAGAPQWLKLTRSGDSVTGYESADGEDWSEVGTVELDHLAPEVEVGMFVTSPDAVAVERQLGGESINAEPTVGEATFDNVSVEPESDPSASADAGWTDYAGSSVGSSEESDGTFTVRGSGDIGERDDRRFDDGLVEMTLMGVMIGMLAVIALGVLFITSEHKRGLFRTTLAACPRRGPVLLAKAFVLGGVTFAAGLVASFTSFLVAEPMLRSNGFEPPQYPETSLTDPTVLRAVVGTAALLAVVAVLSLAVGAIFRRSAAAITTVVLLLVVPQILQTGLPLSVARWLIRLTPSAGFSVQRTVERYDDAIAPVAGFGVLCTYAAVALGAACWLVNRRDA